MGAAHLCPTQPSCMRRSSWCLVMESAQTGSGWSDDGEACDGCCCACDACGCCTSDVAAVVPTMPGMGAASGAMGAAMRNFCPSAVVTVDLIV